MMVSAPDILDASILIVDDQESNRSSSRRFCASSPSSAARALSSCGSNRTAFGP
jgi:hypothetical protein